MEKNEILSLPLFDKIPEGGYDIMIDCFCGEIQRFDKGVSIFRNKKHFVGFILSGKVNGIPPEHFFTLPATPQIDFVALEATDVLILDAHMLLHPCYGVCPFHAQLLENMRALHIDFYALHAK